MADSTRTPGPPPGSSEVPRATPRGPRDPWLPQGLANYRHEKEGFLGMFHKGHNYHMAYYIYPTIFFSLQQRIPKIIWGGGKNQNLSLFLWRLSLVPGMLKGVLNSWLQQKKTGGNKWLKDVQDVRTVWVADRMLVSRSFSISERIHKKIKKTMLFWNHPVKIFGASLSVLAMYIIFRFCWFKQYTSWGEGFPLGGPNWHLQTQAMTRVEDSFWKTCTFTYTWFEITWGPNLHSSCISSRSVQSSTKLCRRGW